MPVCVVLQLAAVLGVRRKVIRLAPDSVAADTTGFAPGECCSIGVCVHTQDIETELIVQLLCKQELYEPTHVQVSEAQVCTAVYN